jgi:hypothetical protein
MWTNIGLTERCLMCDKCDVLKEAVEFYADIKNWHTSYFLVVTPTSDSDQIVRDDLENIIAKDGSYEKDIGGKRAREALKKIEGMK